MLTNFIVRLVDLSRRFALPVILAALVLSGVSGWYVTGHFKINTDVNQMMAANLPWRKQEVAMEKAFPQKVDLTLIVLDGPTPDAVDDAASRLTAKLAAMPDKFTYVERPDAIPFFRKNGLLFLSKTELSDTLNQMVQAQPMLGAITADPSLRGFFGAIDLMLQGVAHNALPFDRLEKPLNVIADTVEADLAGKDLPLAWQSMSSDAKPAPGDLRKLILVKPVLDYNALEPGLAASNIIHQLARDMHFADEGVTVRLTGSVPLNDEEFATVANGTGFATMLSGAMVFLLLMIALRSLRIVLPILLTLVAGLIVTTAFALLAVGSLNLISVAFAVMFIGIAVDFGIQFGVRYRDQHHQEPDHAHAMKRTAFVIAIPLAMAAGSTSLGFLAFIPTDYTGVSELGLIAGVGMLIAFFLNITLLPALLAFTHPPAEPEAVGYRRLAPLDAFLVKHRRGVLIFAAVIAVTGAGIATHLRFDFDPLNLKDPHTESVSTLFDLMKDPNFNPYTIDILRPSLKDAAALAAQLGKLPEVDHAMTLASFVPEDQDAKLAMIGDAAMILGPTFSLPATQPPPANADIFASLKKTADALAPYAAQHPSAARLEKDLDAVVTRDDPALIDRLNANIVDVMKVKLQQVETALGAEKVTPENVGPDLRRDWVTADGQYLVEVYPKGNPRDHKVLTAFTKTVQNIAPDATGSPISIQASGDTVTNAFIHAGCYAVVAIALLALLVLRRLRDVLMMLMPLILAGILTLATIVLIGLPLNFANIIALPLLLSLGVSYAIYFVSYWRVGSQNPLQSSMARAVLFSAATVLVAFGSLALSLHPGTSGMGKLLTVALVYSLICTFFILPALLGRPKSDRQ